MPGFIYAKNKVPELQRKYQAAFRNHTRIWKIGRAGGLFYNTYLVALFGTTACTMYMMCRKVLGYNSSFGPK